MISLTVKGDNLAAFVRDTLRDGQAAEDQAARMVAMRAARDLRKQIKSLFGTEWRVWNAPGFAKAIRVRKLGQGWYRLESKAVYLRGRSEATDLMWVFDQAPIVTSGFGKGGVAIPIPGQTPVASSGRRFAWPSELAARGWELELVPVPGKNFKMIIGRQNRREPFRPLFIWKQSVRMPKRLNLDALFNTYAPTIDTTWADILDGRIAKGAAKKAA